MSRPNGNGVQPELPERWEWKTLGEIGRYYNGRAFKKSEWRTKGRPIIRIQNLNDPTKPYNYFEGEAEERHTVRRGDILMSWAATLDVFRWSGDEAVLNQHIFKVESAISPPFHYWLLRATLDQLRSETHGTAMVHITRGRFLNTRVPIPPADDQERIAARLEALFTALDVADADIDRARAAVAIFVQRSYEELLRLRTSYLPPGWSRRKLSQVARLSSGGTPTRSRPEFYGEGYPWVKIGDLNEGVITGAEETITDAGLAGSSAELLEPGVVMLAMYGASIGRTGVLAVRAATNQAICSMRPNDDLVARDYLFLVIRALKPTFVNAGYGGAQPNISQRFLKEFKIPVPPLETQIELVSEARALGEAAATTTSTVQVSRKRSAVLRNSLLRQALGGFSAPGGGPSEGSAAGGGVRPP